MKDEIITKIKTTLGESGFDAVLVFGYDNIQYLSGAYLHYPPSFPDRYMSIFWPKTEDPTCIIPIEWETSFLNISWINKTRGYVENPGNASPIIEVVSHLAKNTVRKTGKIGVDLKRVPLKLYKNLKEALGEFEIVPCDLWLRNLRMIKTKKELAQLEDVASRTDHALAGQAHHVLVVQASGEMSSTEDVRIHAIERELDEVGHQAIAQVTTGSNTQKFWPGAPNYGIGYDRVPKHHELVRMELVATKNGYWNSGARMLTMGDPTKEQWEKYNALIELLNTGVKAMKPGVKCSEVYKMIIEKSKELGIEIIENLVLGNGVGVSNYEAPYISGSDETELHPGMVITLNPVVKGPNNELMMSKDTVIITEESAKIIGWFKDWREPFIANYTY